MSRLYDEKMIDLIRTEIKNRLSVKKYVHSCNVAKLARDYAEKIGYDTSKAEVAGLLHDVARECNDDELLEIAKKYNVVLSQFDREFPPSVHGKVGAAIAEFEFNIHDKDVLNAIRNHVTGRPCICLLEEIIYIADHIDHINVLKTPKQIEQGKKLVDQWLTESLDDAAYKTLSLVIQCDTDKGRKIDERTEQFFDWLLERIEKNNQIEPEEIYKQKLKELDKRIDDLIDLYRAHVISLPNVKNLRDLGGYQNSYGKSIKKHQILRSGNLDKFTLDDYQKLSEIGINYVIDLREPSEKSPHLENDIPGIHYINLPFHIEMDFMAYSKKLVNWMDDCNNPDELIWLTAKYFNSMDINKMYLELLFNPETMNVIINIVKIMLRSDCTGILYFCQAGKDRTGIVSSFIMNALGINSTAILDDYLASQVSYYAITMNYLNMMRENGFNTDTLNHVIDTLSVYEDRPKELNQAVLSRFGNFKNFFDISRFITEEESEQLEKKYLN